MPGSFADFINDVGTGGAWRNPTSSGNDFNVGQLEAEYGYQVAKPQISFWDMLNGGYQTKYQKYYQDLADRKANAESLVSARAYESSAIQRQVADMKAAGLNPYWLTSASASATGSSSSSESRNTYKPSGSSAKTGGDFMSLLKTLAVVAMVAMK